MFIVNGLKYQLGFLKDAQTEDGINIKSTVSTKKVSEVVLGSLVAKDPPSQTPVSENLYPNDAPTRVTSEAVTIPVKNANKEQEGSPSSLSSEDSPYQVTNKCGRITVFDSCLARGVVDNLYYFTKADWMHLNLKKLQQVTYSAAYDQSSARWLVTDLKPFFTEEQLVVKERSKYKTLHCKIKAILDDENEVVVEPGKSDLASDSFRVSKKSLPKDYPAQKGDWLSIKLKTSLAKDKGASEKCSSTDMDLQSAKVVSVQWTEQKNTHGEVIKVGHKFCIDGFISYTQDVVENSLNLKIGSEVRVVSVSSDHDNDFSHRACSVHLIRNGNGSQQYPEEDKESSLVNEEEFDQLFLNKCDIRISPRRTVSFRPVRVGMTSDSMITIQNTGSKPVLLEKIHIGNFQDVCHFKLNFEGSSRDERTREGRMITISPGVPFVLKITSTFVQLGRTRELCLFDFGDFQIGRWLSVTALANEDDVIKANKRRPEEKSKHWMKSRKEAFKNAKMLHSKNLRTVRGPWAIKAPFFIAHKIPANSIPKDLFKIFKEEDTKALEAKYPGVDWHALTAKNYVERFHVALWFEETEHDILRRQYDMHDTVLHPRGNELMLLVPNLKEFHPPVLLKDPIRCLIPNDARNLQYDGHISKIVYPDDGSPQLYMIFNPDFHRNYAGEPLTVQFRTGRNTYRRAHFAIDQAMTFLGPSWLFPETVTLKAPRVQFFEDEDDNLQPALTNKNVLAQARSEPSTPSKSLSNSPSSGFISTYENGQTTISQLHGRPKCIFNFDSNVREPLNRWSMKLRWFNPSLNEEQKDCVRRILRGQGRPLPYIIFGPPGTGKTVTLVEAILQVYFIETSSRILITVPSNAGADLIAEQLVQTNRFVPGDFVRLNGFARAEYPVSETIADFCADGEHLESVAKHRLIISTVATAGQFFQLNLNTGHFSHVFVDEAGYCTEPEALIAVVLTAINKEGQVILAGDPKQLGPVLMCDIGVNEILTKSLLERLMESPIYSRDEVAFPETKYNPAVLTKLVKCYRAHEMLLKLPSELFYSNELVSHATYEHAYELSEKLDFLPKKGVPLIFHGIQGSSFKDNDSPSWYNLAEMCQVVDYVRKLKSNGVANQDIGIITPYRKQVEKIKTALHIALQEDNIPKVASVEEFQGGERKVMIISTVRTEYTDLIRKKFKGNKLSFIFSKKRFNVAVTRAKALMIIVGDPHVLFKDNGEIKCWSRLLRFAVEAGVYLGCDKPMQLDVKMQEFAGLTINESASSNASVGSEQKSISSFPPLVTHSGGRVVSDIENDAGSFSGSTGSASGSASGNGNNRDNDSDIDSGSDSDDEPEMYTPARPYYHSRF